MKAVLTTKSTLFLLYIVLCFCFNVQAQEIYVVKDQYIVSSSKSARSTRLSGRKLSRNKNIRLINHQGKSRRSIVKTVTKKGIKNLVPYKFSDNACDDILANNPGIASCVPNFFISIQATPDDPYYNNCQSGTCVCDPNFQDGEPTNQSECLWGLENANDSDIDASSAWDIAIGNPNQIIAVLDSGVDYRHPDIAANMWVNPGEIPGNNIDDDLNGIIDDVHGANFNFDDPEFAEGDPDDYFGHGTHVAGTIAAVANNQTGITGVSWNTQVMAIRILNSSGGGTLSDAIAGINYVTDMAVNYGQDVIAMNNSWGGFMPASVVYSENGLADVVEAANLAGILFVAAAGNGQVNPISGERHGVSIDVFPHYPATLSNDNVISVAATNVDGNIDYYSNYSSTLVHVAAPGSDIRSLQSQNSNFGYGLLDGTSVASGTSMAAPHVSGVIALLSDHYATSSHLALKATLLRHVRILPNVSDQQNIVTGGIVNAYQALTDGLMPAPSVSPQPSPSISPVPTPEPIKEYKLKVRSKPRAKGKNKTRWASKNISDNDRLRVDISSNTQSVTNELLRLHVKLDGRYCPVPEAFIEMDGAKVVLQGSVPKLTKRIKHIGFELYNDSNELQDSKRLRVQTNRNVRLTNKRFNKICRKILLNKK